MIRVGYPPPDIRQVSGPFVRTALIGEPLDVAWIRFLGRLQPDDARADLRVLLLMRQLVQRWWIDVPTAAPLLQVSPIEAAAALNELVKVTVEGHPVLEPVAGVPAGAPDAWRISPSARGALAGEDAAVGQQRRIPSRAEVALDWAGARGRVSTTELASIVAAKPPNVGGVLRRLEEAGQRRPTARCAGGRATPTHRCSVAMGSRPVVDRMAPGHWLLTAWLRHPARPGRPSVAGSVHECRRCTTLPARRFRRSSGPRRGRRRARPPAGSPRDSCC